MELLQVLIGAFADVGAIFFLTILLVAVDSAEYGSLILYCIDELFLQSLHSYKMGKFNSKGELELPKTEEVVWCTLFYFIFIHR